MTPEELQRKLDGVADQVGEAGQGPANWIRNNTAKFALIFVAVMVVVVLISLNVGQ